MDEQLREWLEACWREFLSWPRYQDADVALETLLALFPLNSHLPSVMLKVAVIDSLYNTRLPDIHSVSQRIAAIANLDQLLVRGEAEAVNQIRDIGRGPQGLYSFATKYCHWHSPRSFPIYDKFVKWILPVINGDHPFLNGPAEENNLDDFNGLDNAIHALMVHVGMDVSEYRKIDHALWIYGKYHFVEHRTRNRLVEHTDTLEGTPIRQRLDREFERIFGHLYNGPVCPEGCGF
jgi:hypothetical protein